MSKYICEQGHILPSLFDECPICECVVEEAEECEHCHEIVPKIDLDQGYCPDCQDALVDYMVVTLRLFTTPKERKLLREFMSEEDFEKLWEE